MVARRYRTLPRSILALRSSRSVLNAYLRIGQRTIEKTRSTPQRALDKTLPQLINSQLSTGSSSPSSDHQHDTNGTKNTQKTIGIFHGKYAGANEVKMRNQSNGCWVPGSPWERNQKEEYVDGNAKTQQHNTRKNHTLNHGVFSSSLNDVCLKTDKTLPCVCRFRASGMRLYLQPTLKTMGFIYFQDIVIVRGVVHDGLQNC